MIDFIDLINRFDGVTAAHDFESDEVTTKYIKITFLTLRKYVSIGELNDIRTELPKELKSLIFEETPEARFNLGMAYRDVGQVQQSKKHLRAFLETSDQSHKNEVSLALKWLKEK